MAANLEMNNGRNMNAGHATSMNMTDYRYPNAWNTEQIGGGGTVEGGGASLVGPWVEAHVLADRPPPGTEMEEQQGRMGMMQVGGLSEDERQRMSALEVENCEMAGKMASLEAALRERTAESAELREQLMAFSTAMQAHGPQSEAFSRGELLKQNFGLKQQVKELQSDKEILLKKISDLSHQQMVMGTSGSGMGAGMLVRPSTPQGMDGNRGSSTLALNGQQQSPRLTRTISPNFTHSGGNDVVSNWRSPGPRENTTEISPPPLRLSKSTTEVDALTTVGQMAPGSDSPSSVVENNHLPLVVRSQSVPPPSDPANMQLVLAARPGAPTLNANPSPPARHLNPNLMSSAGLGAVRGALLTYSRGRTDGQEDVIRHLDSLKRHGRVSEHDIVLGVMEKARQLIAHVALPVAPPGRAFGLGFKGGAKAQVEADENFLKNRPAKLAGGMLGAMVSFAWGPASAFEELLQEIPSLLVRRLLTIEFLNAVFSRVGRAGIEALLCDLKSLDALLGVREEQMPSVKELTNCKVLVMVNTKNGTEWKRRWVFGVK